ncbi:hypothetical protein ACQKGC_15605 [Allorhizobium pseudoryzae]|uniref:hypothetical protein n=1 Tax=Allorhizobium pseudoryzae TaxID=379684 RepID=UPI0013EC19AF|nr:hypothetical protein [Allorhizobium pseudoryzae]
MQFSNNERNFIAQSFDAKALLRYDGGSYQQERYTPMCEDNEENIVRVTADEIREKIAREGSKSDWARVDALTDEEIVASMRDDPDWQDLIDIDWSEATWVEPRRKKTIVPPPE